MRAYKKVGAANGHLSILPTLVGTVFTAQTERQLEPRLQHNQLFPFYFIALQYSAASHEQSQTRLSTVDPLQMEIR